MSEEVTKLEDRLRDSLRRLKAANSTEFPWNVKLQLIVDATELQCELQLAISAEVMKVLDANAENIKRLRDKVMASFK